MSCVGYCGYIGEMHCLCFFKRILDVRFVERIFLLSFPFTGNILIMLHVHSAITYYIMLTS